MSKTAASEIWEYQVIKLPLRDAADLTSRLTSWGNLGFELVDVVARPFRPAMIFLKRRK